MTHYIESVSLKDAVMITATGIKPMPIENVFVDFPIDLLKIANQYAKDNKSKLLPQKMSGESFIKLLVKGSLTLKQQAQKNLIIKYLNKVQLTPFPLVPDILTQCLQLETAERRLTSYVSENDFEKLKNKFMLPECLKGWFEYSNLNLDQLLNEGIRKIKENSRSYSNKVYGRFYRHNDIINVMKSLKTALNNSNFKVICGPAGSGKSTEVIRSITSPQNMHKRILVVTLSNTIGMMFKQKCQECSNLKTMSITLAKLLLSNDKFNSHDVIGNDILIIDEFSQWGIESAEVLLDLLNANNTAKVFMMGDLNQIPTFLSSGSLMYSIMDTWPERTEEKKTLYRFINTKDTMYKIISGEDIDVEVSKFDKNILEEVDCVITGTNAHVFMLNNVMISVKFKGIDTLGLTLFQTIMKCLKQYPDKKFSIISDGTFTYSSGRKMKIFSNERFNVELKLGIPIATSIVEPKKKCIISEEFLQNFKAGYAITVNKAQGLEWDNTVVYIDQTDKNLMTRNALYVAVSRSKQRLILVTEPEDKTKAVTPENVNRILKTGYKAENLFKI